MPSISGFVSEAFEFLVAFQANKLWAILSTLGIVLGAGYMLWTFQRVFMGTLPEKWETVLDDVTARETFMLAPLVIIIVVLGVYPTPALNWMATSMGRLVELIHSSAGQAMVSGF